MAKTLGVIAIVVLMAGAFFLGRTATADAQTQPPPKAPTRTLWEYKDGANLSDTQLNQMGADGWELCALVQYGRDYYYVFKRAK